MSCWILHRLLVYAFVTREFRQDLTRNVTRNTRLVSRLRAGHDTRHEIWCTFVPFRVHTKYTNTKHENLKLKMALGSHGMALSSRGMALSSHRMTPGSHGVALGSHKVALGSHAMTAESHKDAIRSHKRPRKLI